MFDVVLLYFVFVYDEQSVDLKPSLLNVGAPRCNHPHKKMKSTNKQIAEANWREVD
jgi:hypothetical protein